MYDPLEKNLIISEMNSDHSLSKTWTDTGNMDIFPSLIIFAIFNGQQSACEKQTVPDQNLRPSY